MLIGNLIKCALALLAATKKTTAVHVGLKDTAANERDNLNAVHVAVEIDSAPMQLQGRAVTTITIYGGYGNPSTSASQIGTVSGTASNGATSLLTRYSTTTTHATSTMTAARPTNSTDSSHHKPTFSLTYASGVPTAKTTSAIPSLVSLSASSSLSTTTPPQTTSSTTSSTTASSTAATTLSGLTIPAESATATESPNAAETHNRSGCGHVDPVLAIVFSTVALAIIFAN